MAGETCKTEGCGKVLGKRNKSGVCRSCVARRVNADPSHRAKRIAGTIAMHKTPERRRLNQQLARQAGTYWSTPEGRQRRREMGKARYANLDTPEMREKCRIARAEATRLRYAREFAWLPVERREEYNALVRSKRLKAAEAKQIILASLAKEAVPETFEEKLARVQSGQAQVVPVLTRHHLQPTVRS